MVCVASTKSSKEPVELILCFIVGYSKKSHYTFPTDRRFIWSKEPNQLGTFQPETCGYEVSSVQKGIFNIASFFNDSHNRWFRSSSSLHHFQFPVVGICG